jgi:hypothetical protein
MSLNFTPELKCFIFFLDPFKVGLKPNANEPEKANGENKDNELFESWVLVSPLYEFLLGYKLPVGPLGTIFHDL